MVISSGIKYTLLTILLLVAFYTPTHTSAYQSVNFNYDNQQAGVLSSLLNIFFNTANAQTPDITTGLVGHWTFDETEGTTAGDSSGNNNTGVLTGEPIWTTGQIDGALSFDGTDDYVNVNNASSLQNLTNHTISAWVYPRTLSGIDIIVEKYDGSLPMEFDLYASNGNLTSIKTAACSSNLAITTNTWSHVVMTYDGTTIRMYKDAILGSGTCDQAYTSESADLGIGVRPSDLSNNFDGTIDDVRIYDRALTSADITELYNLGNIPTPDTTPPTLSNESPTGALSSGTTQTNITLDTNETATCKWSATPDTLYSAMTTFDTTNTTSHSTLIPDLSDGNSYTYYMLCEDTALNQNTTDYPISFSVDNSPVPDEEDPSIPTNLTANPVSSSQINLSWDESTDNVGVTGYNIYRDGTFITTSSNASYSDTGLTSETQYTYTVSAYDAQDNMSEQIVGVMVITPVVSATICEASSGYNCWYVSTTGNNTNNGSFGAPFGTVQYALDNMSGGDTIYLMSGIYQEGHINIPRTKNGTCTDTDCTNGSWSALKSYPGEWAVLDGNNNTAYSGSSYGSVLGNVEYDTAATFDLKYWWFEKFEIKNGRTAVDTPTDCQAAGFFASGGPFKFRYMYIHDNACTSYTGVNPGGLKGQHWHDSIVEYSYFENNGAVSGNINNAAHILSYADYDHINTARDGFNDNNISNRPVARNIIRYNYFEGGVAGFKHKSTQLFSGRNPNEGYGLDDTYKDYGDKIHHNIFRNGRGYAIGANQDFVQVYNNIIDNSRIGIVIQYEPKYQIYKAVTYNNEMIDIGEISLVRFAKDTFETVYGIIEPKEHYGWDYNNIFDNVGSYNNWCPTHALNPVPSGSGCGSVNFDLTNYYSSSNYFYRLISPQLYKMQDVSYTASEFEAQTYTADPRVVYTNSYDGANLLYAGTTGADKYITSGSHRIEGSTTIENGGTGGPHPYLSGVTIPSYVGAVNPTDNDWVAGVLGLADVSILQSGTSGDPSWIESDGTPVSADLNSDTFVNSIDWSILNTAWGTNNPTLDLNNDSTINSLDWSVMNAQWSL